MSDPITIADYDPGWPHHFEALRAKIAQALGPMASAIEHVGSTAVPGLAAKPTIDLDVLLHARADLPRAIQILASLGYEYEGDLGIPGREAFRPPSADFPHHLYVCAPESVEFDRHVAFRNYLRAHPEEATAYANLKRSLATRHSTDREAYTQAKTEFVEQTLRRARSTKRELSCVPDRTIS